MATGRVFLRPRTDQELMAHTPCYLTVRGKRPFIAEQKVRVWVAGQMATEPHKGHPRARWLGQTPLRAPLLSLVLQMFIDRRNQIPTNNKGTLKNNLSIHKRRQGQLHPSLPVACLQNAKSGRKSFPFNCLQVQIQSQLEGRRVTG